MSSESDDVTPKSLWDRIVIVDKHFVQADVKSIMAGGSGRPVGI